MSLDRQHGQQALLARRLVEAGTSFANVVMEHPGGNKEPKNAVYNWDCHAVNCHVALGLWWRFANRASHRFDEFPR